MDSRSSGSIDGRPSRFVIDSDGLDTLFVRYAGGIHRWFSSRVDSDATAVDLTAETFAEAWCSRARYVPNADNDAGPWLYGIALNLHRAWSRKQRIERSARDQLGMDVRTQPDDDDVAERLLCEQLGEALLSALDLLPPDQRAAIDLRIVQEKSYEEVAALLKCSQPTARMRVMRGLRTLNLKLKASYT